MRKCICDVLEGAEEVITEGCYVDLFINNQDGEYRIEAIGEGNASMRLNYCPDCRKKLTT